MFATAGRLEVDGVTVAHRVGAWSTWDAGNATEGQHVVRLMREGGVIAESHVWVVRGACRLSLAAPEVRPGEAVSVQVRNAPGMMLDYVAIYPCAAAPDTPAVYAYTEAIISGLVVLKPPFVMEGNRPLWPLPVGCYKVVLLRDDDPTWIAGGPAELRVVAADPDVPLVEIVVPAALALALCFFTVGVLVIAYRRHRQQERNEVQFQRV